MKTVKESPTKDVPIILEDKILVPGGQSALTKACVINGDVQAINNVTEADMNHVTIGDDNEKDNPNERDNPSESSKPNTVPKDGGSLVVTGAITTYGNEGAMCAVPVPTALEGLRDISTLNIAGLFHEEVSPDEIERDPIKKKYPLVCGTPLPQRKKKVNNLKDKKSREASGTFVNLLNSSNESNFSGQSTMTTRSMIKANRGDELNSASPTYGR